MCVPCKCVCHVNVGHICHRCDACCSARGSQSMTCYIWHGILFLALHRPRDGRATGKPSVVHLPFTYTSKKCCRKKEVWALPEEVLPASACMQIHALMQVRACKCVHICTRTTRITILHTHNEKITQMRFAWRFDDRLPLSPVRTSPSTI